MSREDRGAADDLARRVDAAVRSGLAKTGTPGAVLRVSRDGALLVRGAWGAARTHDEHGRLPTPTPMRTGTLVDVASITKVAATTAVAMALVQQGLDLDLPVRSVVPELHETVREVTLVHLLHHSSGLPDWRPLFLEAAAPDRALEVLCATPLATAPGSTRVYSDLGMALLGVALERVAGDTLDELARSLVHRPLGMRSTTYLPSVQERDQCAATSTGNPVERRMVLQRYPHPALDDVPSWWRPRTLLGEVNDANAAVAWAGVAGHAGLFSTVDDLGAFGEELERAARGADGRVFTAATVSRFTTTGRHPGQALGFWTNRIAASSGPDDDTSFGHSGFTGCELLVSPRDRMVVVLLTNRLHGGDPPPPHDELWAPVLRTLVACVRTAR